jgi:hypothetical protein
MRWGAKNFAYHYLRERHRVEREAEKVAERYRKSMY